MLVRAYLVEVHMDRDDRIRIISTRFERTKYEVFNGKLWHL